MPVRRAATPVAVPAATGRVRARGPVLPARPGRGVLVLGMLVVAFLGISTTTGTGWPIVLVAILIATLVASFVLPVVPLAGARLEVRAPVDAVAGLPLTIDVVSPSSAAIRACVPALDRGWFRLGSGQLVVVPARRGVLEVVRVDLRCASPLGLWPWKRRLWVTLERPLHVAPAPVPVELRLPPDAVHRGDELTRGIRPYEAGDGLRDVHWPATARAGSLQVRERETDDRLHVELVVDLGAPGELATDAVELRAGRAAGAGQALLAAGRVLVVHTNEGGHPASAAVRERRELGRRLARAVPGPVARPASGLVVDVAALGGPS